VIYVSQSADQSSDSFDLEPITLAPGIVRAARNIYQAYADTHGTKQVPIGVALDRYTLRGQLIFTSRPILLPHECFVPMRNIEMFDPDDTED
jgi:hypothetical protein